jgi:hypothetical protein
VSRLAVGPETSVVYGIVGAGGTLVLLNAATAETLVRIPINEAATSMVVGNHPQAPPPATRTPTQTSTPTTTPTLTPTPTRTLLPVLIAAGSAVGSPDEEVEIEVVLISRGHEVAGMQNDLELDGPITVVSCAANPDLGKDLSAFEIGAGSVRAIIFGYNLIPFPQETVAYTCRVRIAASAAAGPTAVRVSLALASNPSGDRLPVSTSDGSIDVRPSVETTGESATDAQEGLVTGSSNGGCTLGSDPKRSSGGHWIAPGLLGWGLLWAVRKRRITRAAACRRRDD